MPRAYSSYEGVDPEIAKACYAATRDFLSIQNGNNFEDTLQDAFMIAFSKRGNKVAKTCTEYYFKVYYGLIDLYRSRTHSRALKRSGQHLPVFLSMHDAEKEMNFKIENYSLNKWTFSESDTLYSVNKGSETFRISSDNLHNQITLLISLFNRRDREIITRHLNGENKTVIAKYFGIQSNVITSVLNVFKMLLKQRLISA